MDQLWALVDRMARNALVDKARVFRRLQQTEGEDGRFAQDFSRRLRLMDRRSSGVEIEIDRAMRLFGDRTDRQILSLWLVGTAHNEIASFVDLTPAAVRKRWQKIKATLQGSFAAEVGR